VKPTVTPDKSQCFIESASEQAAHTSTVCALFDKTT
jgi:hypothetical protein